MVTNFESKRTEVFINFKLYRKCFSIRESLKVRRTSHHETEEDKTIDLILCRYERYANAYASVVQFDSAEPWVEGENVDFVAEKMEELFGLNF